MYRIAVSLAFLTLLPTSTESADRCPANFIPTVPEPLYVYSQFPGYFWAQSARPDQKAFGFGPSTNAQHELEPDSPYANKGIQLVALPKKSERFLNRYEGFVVLLVNGSPNELSLSASDSRLSIIREAVDTDGVWKPIEYLPTSWCGNSYHRVFISSEQYWRFAVPRYAGAYVTKMRFRLELGYGGVIFSNVFSGTMNRDQFPRSADARTRYTISREDLERLPVDRLQGAVALEPGVVVTGGRPR